MGTLYAQETPRAKRNFRSSVTHRLSFFQNGHCWKRGRIKGGCRTALTEEVGEDVRLVVVHSSHAQRVEAHQAEHGPVEGLRLDHVADEEAQPTLALVEGGALQLGALQAGPGKRGSCGNGDGSGMGERER